MTGRCQQAWNDLSSLVHDGTGAYSQLTGFDGDGQLALQSREGLFRTLCIILQLLRQTADDLKQEAGRDWMLTGPLVDRDTATDLLTVESKARYSSSKRDGLHDQLASCVHDVSKRYRGPQSRAVRCRHRCHSGQIRSGARAGSHVSCGLRSATGAFKKKKKGA
jgi:hypothetical protein